MHTQKNPCPVQPNRRRKGNFSKIKKKIEGGGRGLGMQQEENFFPWFYHIHENRSDIKLKQFQKNSRDHGLSFVWFDTDHHYCLTGIFMEIAESKYYHVLLFYMIYY